MRERSVDYRAVRPKLSNLHPSLHYVNLMFEPWHRPVTTVFDTVDDKAWAQIIIDQFRQMEGRVW